MRETPGFPHSPDIPEQKNNQPKDQSRRNFLKFGLKAAAGVAGIAASKKLYDYATEESLEMKEYGVEKLEDITEFQDLGEGVLVIGANSSERKSVIDFLKKHSQQRKSNTRFLVTERGEVASAGIPVRKREDKGLPPGEYPHGTNTINLKVVSKDELEGKDIGTGYGIIQLRGHTDDMPDLIELFKKYRAENCILIMGGCESVQFMKDYYSPKTAIMADKMDVPAFTAHNSHNLMAIIDRIGLADSWEELNQMMEANSQRLRSQTVMPGSQNYLKYVAKK